MQDEHDEHEHDVHEHHHEEEVGYGDPELYPGNQINLDEHGHSHETTGNVLVDAWNIFSDPAHFIAEIGFSLVIDFVIIFLGYQLFIKKLVIPRLRKQIHRELDAEIHIEHHDDGGHSHGEHTD